MSPSRPIKRHSVSNCSCLLAAMFKSPSPVRNVPDGLAVMFSLPMGCGFTSAMSQFDTAQPIATSEASSMETSMNSPSPRALASNERRGNRESRRHSAHRVGDRIADPQWRRLRVASDAHHSAQSLDDLVVGGIGLERSILAETGDRAVDDVVLDRLKRRITESKPLHDA